MTLEERAIPAAVERVARAICRAGGADPDSRRLVPHPTKKVDLAPAWMLFVPHAEAALAAMGEQPPVRRTRISEKARPPKDQ